MLKVVEIEYSIPKLIPNQGAPLARQRSSGTGYLLSSGAEFCFPLGRRWIEEDLKRLAPREGGSITEYSEAITMTVAAQDCATELMKSRPLDQLKSLRDILFCHSTINENMVACIPSLVQARLGVSGAYLCSFSQLSSCSVLLALQFVLQTRKRSGKEDLFLIVAADKWLYPMPRSFGTLVNQGDAAAAILLQNSTQGDRQEVLVKDVVVKTLPGYSDALFSDPFTIEMKLKKDVAENIQLFLNKNKTTAQEIYGIVAPNFRIDFVEACLEASQLQKKPIFQSNSNGVHLSCADPLIGLSKCMERMKSDSLDFSKKQILLWTCGTGGDIGCALISVEHQMF
jgi:3-oxoacyl-[acyl-carrier-protein] synthase III